MKHKTLFFSLVTLTIVIAAGFLFFRPGKDDNQQLNAPEAKKEIIPSETSIEYADPAGFSFSYPDNLSIEKNEEVDTNTYADLQLFSKDVNGSLALRITDTKLKTLEDWIKEASSSNTPVEKKLGNLKALEVKTNDRLMLAALDQGVLFTIEMPLIEQQFWMKVYEKVLTGFTFISPETAAAGVSNPASEEVVFEGEEVVE